MATIKIKNSLLDIPNNPTIPYIPGDGIGPEIWEATKKIVNHAIKRTYKNTRSIIWKKCYAGKSALKKFGTSLPQETLDHLKEYKVSIKSPLETPVGGGIKSINVAIRHSLDLYACIRPIEWFKGVPSPVKRPQDVSMTIFRENTEDIYAGIEWDYDSSEAKLIKDILINQLGVKTLRFPETTSISIKPVSKEGSERLIHAAIQYAVDHNKPTVTLVHKGNIMKSTEGSFRNWGYSYAQSVFKNQVFTMVEYNKIKEKNGYSAAEKAFKKAKKEKKIIINDCITDAFFQNILLTPLQYSVIATLNLNGDYISDALAAQVGGIGIAPGANINPVTGHAVFEATHGTAPTIAGQDKANPSALILSAVMMLDYIGWKEVAKSIKKGLLQTISDKTVTSDFNMPNATVIGTKAFTQKIIENLG